MSPPTCVHVERFVGCGINRIPIGVDVEHEPRGQFASWCSNTGGTMLEEEETISTYAKRRM